jgi:rhomboid family GlyGly-CTERM serine protease
VASLHFHPELVVRGEWWRLLTHPFVHVSLYHLVLDAVAFLVLYATLKEKRMLRRLAYCAGSAVGSLALSLLLSPAVYSLGLCGLSGIAHGLMAVTGLEMASSRTDSTVARIGRVTLALLSAKVLYEAVTGEVLFAASHLGDIGTPIAACHLGGVSGAAIVYWRQRAAAAVSDR